MNEDRTARGLIAYRSWGALASLAGERAQRMADTRTMSHAAAGGDLGAAYDANGIQWFGHGETIGVSSYPWGSDAAMSIYNGWMGSPPHRAIMLSDDVQLRRHRRRSRARTDRRGSPPCTRNPWTTRRRWRATAR